MCKSKHIHSKNRLVDREGEHLAEEVAGLCPRSAGTPLMLLSHHTGALLGKAEISLAGMDTLICVCVCVQTLMI